MPLSSSAWNVLGYSFENNKPAHLRRRRRVGLFDYFSDKSKQSNDLKLRLNEIQGAI
jgi:hypothetical protein